MKLKYTPEAISDLQEIKHYIKTTLHNPTAANRISKKILDACSDLKRFPEIGMSVEAKTGFETDLRMLVCEGQIAFYRMDSRTDTVSIARIVSARQDYIQLLFGDMVLMPEQTLEENLEQEPALNGPTMTF